MLHVHRFVATEFFRVIVIAYGTRQRRTSGRRARDENDVPGHLATLRSLFAAPLGLVRSVAPREGTAMPARFRQFFEIRDRRIANPRNYDCFERW
jgi:hypothetical protein